MKKYILLALLFLSIGTFAQKLPNFPVSYRITGVDTILRKEVVQNNGWGLTLMVYNPDTTDGVFSIMISSNDTLYSLYDNAMTISIADMDSTVVGGDTIYYCRFADSWFEGNYYGIKFVANNVTEGYIKGILTLKKQ